MSYRFEFAAASREQAKQQIAQQFDAIEAEQPAHSLDRAQAAAAADAFLAACPEPGEKQQLYVSMYGSLNYQREPVTAAGVLGASVSVSIALIARR